MQSRRISSADNSTSMASVPSSNRTDDASDESQAALAIVQLTSSNCNGNGNTYHDPTGKNTVTESNEVGTVIIPLADSGLNGDKDQGRGDIATASTAGDMMTMTTVPAAGGGNGNAPVANTMISTAAAFTSTTVDDTTKDQGRNGTTVLVKNKDQGSKDTTLLVDDVAAADAAAEPTAATTLVATMPTPSGKETRAVAVHIAGSKCFSIESVTDSVRFVDAKGTDHHSLGSYPKTPALVRRSSTKDKVNDQEKQQPNSVGKARKTSDAENNSVLKKPRFASPSAIGKTSDANNGSMLKKPRRASTAAVVRFESNSASTPASRAKARRAKMAAEATKLLSDDQKKSAAAGIDMNLTDEDGEPIPVVVSAKYAHNGNYIGASVTVALAGVYDIGRVEGLGDKQGTYWLSVGGRRYLVDREPIDKALDGDEKDDDIDDNGGLFAYQTPAKTNRSVTFDAPNTGASMATTGANDASWVEDAMGINATPYRQFGWSGVVQANERLLDEEETSSRRHLHITDESPIETWSLECLTSPREIEARGIAVDGVVTTDETRSIVSETTVEYPIPGDDDEAKTIDYVADDEGLDSTLGTSFATADGDGNADDETVIITSKNGGEDDEDDEEEDKHSDEKDGDGTAILPKDGDDEIATATIASTKNSIAEFATRGNNKANNDVSSNTVQVEDARPIRLTVSDIHVPSFFAGATFALLLQLSVVAYVAILLFVYRTWMINEKTY